MKNDIIKDIKSEAEIEMEKKIIIWTEMAKKTYVKKNQKEKITINLEKQQMELEEALDILRIKLIAKKDQLKKADEELSLANRLRERSEGLLSILYATRNGEKYVNVEENMEAYDYFADSQFDDYISKEDLDRLFLIVYISRLNEEKRCIAASEAKVEGSYIKYIIEKSKTDAKIRELLNSDKNNNGSQHQKK